MAKRLHEEVELLGGALPVVDAPLLVARLKGRLDCVAGALAGLYSVLTCFELAESACESVDMTVQRRVKERAMLTSQSLESGSAFMMVVQLLYGIRNGLERRCCAYCSMRALSTVMTDASARQSDRCQDVE